MAYVPLEKLTEKNPSLFRLVLALADRANAISRGAPPLVQVASKNACTVALNEFAEKKACYEEIPQAAVQNAAPPEAKE